MLTKSLIVKLPPTHKVLSRIQEEFPTADVSVNDTESVKLIFLFLDPLLKDEDLIINRIKEIV